MTSFDPDTRPTGSERVVAAAVVASDDEKVLLLRRKPDDFLGGLWELPSGRIQSGESVREGLVREVLEETGLVVTAVNGCIGTFEYLSKSGKPTRQLNFEVTVEPGQVALSEHDSSRWVGRDDVAGLSCSSETQGVLEAFWSATSSDMERG